MTTDSSWATSGIATSATGTETNSATAASTDSTGGGGRTGVDDGIGAGFYVIAVIIVYAMSIVALIASHIKRKNRKLLEDRQIHKYLKEFQIVRERSRRDSYRNLKRAVVAKLSRGGGSSDKGAGVGGGVAAWGSMSSGFVGLATAAGALPILAGSASMPALQTTGRYLPTTPVYGIQRCLTRSVVPLSVLALPPSTSAAVAAAAAAVAAGGTAAAVPDATVGGGSGSRLQIRRDNNNSVGSSLIGSTHGGGGEFIPDGNDMVTAVRRPYRRFLDVIDERPGAASSPSKNPYRYLYGRGVDHPRTTNHVYQNIRSVRAAHHRERIVDNDDDHNDEDDEEFNDPALLYDDDDGDDDDDDNESDGGDYNSDCVVDFDRPSASKSGGWRSLPTRKRPLPTTAYAGEFYSRLSPVGDGSHRRRCSLDADDRHRLSEGVIVPVIAVTERGVVAGSRCPRCSHDAAAAAAAAAKTDARRHLVDGRPRQHHPTSTLIIRDSDADAANARSHQGLTHDGSDNIDTDAWQGSHSTSTVVPPTATQDDKAYRMLCQRCRGPELTKTTNTVTSTIVGHGARDVDDVDEPSTIADGTTMRRSPTERSLLDVQQQQQRQQRLKQRQQQITQRRAGVGPHQLQRKPVDRLAVPRPDQAVHITTI